VLALARADYVNPFVWRDTDGANEVVRLNWQLTPTPIDERCELYGAWSTKIEQGVECRPDGATRLYDVIDQNDFLTIEAIGNIAWANPGVGQGGGRVVAVEGDVHGSESDPVSLQLLDPSADDAGERHSPSPNSNEEQAIGGLVSFQYLPGHPSKTPIHAFRVEKLSHGEAGLARAVALCTPVSMTPT
jgi:hypothetical protein